MASILSFLRYRFVQENVLHLPIKTSADTKGHITDASGPPVLQQVKAAWV